jgi:lipopolysaccharide transport system ATP-binding protein
VSTTALDPNVVLKLDDVCKKFCRNLKRSMFYGGVDFLRGAVGLAPEEKKILRTSEFWALNDVSFELKRANTIGIIGRNGSGKSTLLRLIAGVLPPDHGKIAIRGRVGALISLGAGFHPHLSGRDNVFMNGAILGMSRAEISKKLDSIIAFAELGEFIDAPVATYSSGMTVRLGFSIAAHGEPDILLVDEVLAVGDLRFALKCHNRMSEYRRNGGSTLMVTHSNQAIRNMCKEAIWFDHGVIRATGPVNEVCNLYELETGQDLDNSQSAGAERLHYDLNTRISSVEFDGQTGATREEHSKEPVYESNGSLSLRINYALARPVKMPIFTVTIQNMENVVIFSNYSNFDGFNPTELSGEGSINFVIDHLGLKIGKYFVTTSLSEGEVSNTLDFHEKRWSFLVKSEKVSHGLVNPYPKWNLSERA